MAWPQQGGKMPIRRELRGFYPIDWHQLSRVIRFGRIGSAAIFPMTKKSIADGVS